MSKAIFDTSILVDHLRGLEHATKLVKRIEGKEFFGCISALTVAELFAGKDAGTENRKLLLSGLISLFPIIDVNTEIAKQAGTFKRKYNVSLADAIIAATAFYQGSKLFTKNLKDFTKIREIEAEEPY